MQRLLLVGMAGLSFSLTSIPVVAKDDYSLLDELLKYPVPAIREYGWLGAGNEELNDDLVQDYIRFGMNGLQNLCRVPRAGKYFPMKYQPSIVINPPVPHTFINKKGAKVSPWIAE